MGSRYKPFATGGDPAQKQFVVEGVVAEGISDQRQQRPARSAPQAEHAGTRHDRAIRSWRRCDQCEKQAYDLILGDAGKVFDLSQEKDELRDRYGRNTFGQSCLMARRLVEHGVRYVTINYKGWDTHKQHFQTMRRKLPEMDKGMATLLQDLSDRGLLDSTIVWWSGEFGRTPKVQWEPPWNGGRGHYGRVFSAVVAGGGFKGGHVVGASDAKGEEVQGPARLSLGPDRQHVRAARHRPRRRRCPHPQGLGRPRHALGRGRRADRRATEGNHVIRGVHHEPCPRWQSSCGLADADARCRRDQAPRRRRTRTSATSIRPAASKGPRSRSPSAGQYLDGVNQVVVSGEGVQRDGGQAHQAADAEDRSTSCDRSCRKLQQRLQAAQKKQRKVAPRQACPQRVREDREGTGPGRRRT